MSRRGERAGAGCVNKLAALGVKLYRLRRLYGRCQLRVSQRFLGEALDVIRGGVPCEVAVSGQTSHGFPKSACAASK